MRAIQDFLLLLIVAKGKKCKILIQIQGYHYFLGPGSGGFLN